MKMAKGQCGKCGDKWRIRLLYLLLLGFVTVMGRFCFLLGFNAGASMLKTDALIFSEYNDRYSLEHLNVSRNQFYALASLFSESDQIASIDCRKEPGSGNSLNNGVACALSVSFKEKQKFQQTHKTVIRYVDQCPIQDESISTKFDVSFGRGISEVSIPQYIISSSLSGEDHEKNVLQRRDPWNQIKEHRRSLSFDSFLKGCCGIIFGMIMSCKMPFIFFNMWRRSKQMLLRQKSSDVQQKQQPMGQPPQQQLPQSPPKSAGRWRRILLYLGVSLGILASVWLFLHLNQEHTLRRKETLVNMCDERARVLQDQFNVSMNHVHALAILISTFHHGKHPSAIDQKTFCEYTERTSFERPLTSGVAYALRVPHSQREQFEKQQGWKIKKMATEDQTLVQDFVPGNLDPAPIQDEYAPVILSQETVSHIVSIDMMSGKEDRENILRARTSGKGVLTSPFKLLKSNHLGVILTFAVYKTDLPLNATPEQRTEATLGYLGASYDVPSLVERLLHQLASKQTIVVNVYDTTDASDPISMYGADVVDTGHSHVSHLDFGDPHRKHEMHCRFKQKAPIPWTAISASLGVLVITLLVGYIFNAAISEITEVKNAYREMEQLKVRAEAADVAKSQFLATVSHEIRTPMNGVLGMLQMLMDTELDATQREYAQTAHASGKDLISLINEVLDQAKIESGRLELEDVPFDLRAVLDNVLSLFSSKSIAKAIELAVYVSDKVPQVVIGDPGRFRQIITNLVGNSIKFTRDKGHVFVSVHMADEICTLTNSRDEVLEEGLHLVRNSSEDSYNTLSGFPVVNRAKSWEVVQKVNGTHAASEPEVVKLLVTVEDTGVGIPPEAQHRIFTPFMQADSSTSRTYGGTGIGLSISKRLVELMKGKIDFVSEQGTGSTFCFTCVFRKGEKSFLDTKSQLYDPVLLKLQGSQALIVDKRSTRAEVTRYHLRRLGIFSDIALTLESACSLLTNTCNSSALHHGDMVLIEKDVWDTDACVILQRLIKELRRKRNADLQEIFPKIFLLASSISSSERTELKFCGLVDNVLLKPLRLSVLFACFQESLEIGKKEQVAYRKPSMFGNLLKGKQILVVDDNMVNRRVAEGALKKYGAIVTCVESGKAALSMLNPPHNFDACFMDLQMPEMDGFEATRQVRQMEKMVNERIESGEESADIFAYVAHWHTPILAMTADVIQATAEECMRCGMDGYVSKPFEEQQLYSAVAQFFESG